MLDAFGIASAVFLTCALMGLSICAQPNAAGAEQAPPTIRGLTGQVTDIRIAEPAQEGIVLLDSVQPSSDIDLKRMAQWALNYLCETPRKNLNYEPVFQCHPLRCPPVPEGQDPVVACDTDARMDWEWYYMRDVSGSQRGKDVEAAFHKRIRDYVDDEGIVWSPPGCYNENDIHAVYEKKDCIIHIWGTTKILKSLSEDYARTHDPQSKALARKVMLGAKGLAVWDKEGRCWFACGMGALNSDRVTPVPNWWNAHPAPIVEPLVTYWLATKDPEGLQFAKAYADGIVNNLQPDGMRFQPDGSFNGHSHATMHAIWGVAHLGVITGNKTYIDFAKRAWDWMLTRGTGTGWFPALPDNCNETCLISDMMSVAACIAQGGYPEYFDYVERYMRNYISNLQFIVAPEFEAYYRRINTAAGEESITRGLAELRKFQGGVIGGSGLNDYENDLLGGASGFEMFGCCAPEGMRAIYTTWANTIDRLPKSPLGPAGVYVNMSFSRDSEWGQVVSFVPDKGRLTVKASTKDRYFLRVPHWAPHDQVRAFIGTSAVTPQWSGSYVTFDAKPGDELTITYPLVQFTHQVEGLWSSCAPNLRMTFKWRGNMVVSADPPATKTPLFTGKPRVLAPAPGEE